MVVLIIMTVGISLFIYIMGAFMQSFAQSGVFFGIRIPLGYEKNEELIKEKKTFIKYWTLAWILANVVIVPFFFIVREEFTPLIMLINIFGTLILLNVCYYITYKKVKEIKKRENWKELLTSKNVVMVDLKMRNGKGSKVSSLHYLVQFILFLIVLFLGINNGKKSDYLLIVIQFIMLAIMYGSFKAIEKAKQNINGGEINAVKKQSLKYRKGNSLILTVVAYVVSITFTLMNLSIMEIISTRYMATAIILNIAILPVILIWTIIYCRRNKDAVDNAEIKDGKVVINRDDDDNYIMGTIYYNPNDPSLFVEKRMGTGVTFNMAKLFGKVFMGFILALMIGMFPLLYILGSGTKVDAAISPTTLELKGVYSEKINREEIIFIRLENKIPKTTMKTNGAAMGNKKIGYFRLEGGQKAKLFIENSTKKAIKIVTKDKTIFINYEDEKKTEDLYENLGMSQ